MRSRTSSELGLLVVACIGCNAITNLDRYSFTEPDVTHCGSGQEDCATTLRVEGGTFYRGHNGRPKRPRAPSDPATVSAFRLDKFEVTVGRFRMFVDDVVAKRFVATPGTGKHAVHDGKGLATTTGNEDGWSGDALPTSLDRWNTALGEDCGVLGTWTRGPGPNERKPINCVTWSEAYAFCIWSGGFLPSEAEWLRAAIGDDGRNYPWGDDVPPVDEATNELRAVFGCRYEASGTCDRSSVANIAPVGILPAALNAGPFGHLDLAGNVAELTLDLAALENTFPAGRCIDCCSKPTLTGARAVHGGAYNDPRSRLLNFTRTQIGPTARSDVIGFRCAYPP